MSKAPPKPAEQNDWRTMLMAVPVRNQAASIEQHAEGAIVTVPNKSASSYRWPLSLIVRPALEKQLVLDAIGKRIWDLCDGKRTVEHIIDAFASDYVLNFHESRMAVTEYLKSLVQRGALAMRAAKGQEVLSP